MPCGRVQPGPAQSLKERAYQAIKRRIIRGVFKLRSATQRERGGQRPEIGRTPVHQAFDRLHVKELIDVRPRKDIVVRPINLDEVIAIIETRLLNKTFAVRLAAERASAFEIVAIRDTILQAEEVASQDNIERMMLLNREFYRLIARATHSAQAA